MPVALALAIVYLIVAPNSTDFAAQTFRVDLFSEHGFQIWSNAWYEGFHLPGYSILFPPLGSWFGPRLVGAVAVVVASFAFDRIAKQRFGDRARWACLLFGVGAATNLYTGRLTFALGVATGLLALLAIERGRRWPAGVASLATAAASPVAGLFLALAGVALWLRGSRRDGLVLAIPALVAIAVLSFGFPTTGDEPFVFSSFYWAPLSIAVALLVFPREATVLRIGAGLYLVLCVGVFAVANPIGGNVVRLATVFGPALLALFVSQARRPWLAGLAIVPVFFWSLQAPVRDVRNGSGDPSVERSYYAPLLGEMSQVAPDRPFRIEVPPSRERFESVYVAERYPLARGWMRQLESDDLDLFQNGNLAADSYRKWLDDRGVAFVAMSDATPDYLAEDEKELIAAGLPYLHEAWSNEDWKLYRVDDPAPLADPPARVTRLDSNSFRLEAPAGGSYAVRFSSSRWWHVNSGEGCVKSTDEGLEVHLDRPGAVTVTADLSLAGIVGGRGHC